MRMRPPSVLLLFFAVYFPSTAFSENWVEFYSEKWGHMSEKLNRKIQFSSRHMFDRDSISRSSSGNVTLWTKEVASNDRASFKGGGNQNEVLFRKIHVWCKSRKYQYIQVDEGLDTFSEMMSEEIVKGTSFEKLYNAICLEVQKGKN